MGKIIRLTESDLTTLIRKVIKEQSVVQDRDWKTVANSLENAMKGLGTDEDTVYEIIYNTVSNQSEWYKLYNAFGVRDGENLLQWLKGDLSSSEYSKLMTWIKDTMVKGNKEDANKLTEGNFKDLKDNQLKLDTAAAFFRKKAMELKVNPKLIMNFNQSINLLMADIFDKNYKKTGGRIDN